jgi:hypothetical protein
MIYTVKAVIPFLFSGKISSVQAQYLVHIAFPGTCIEWIRLTQNVHSQQSKVRQHQCPKENAVVVNTSNKM